MLYLYEYLQCRHSFKTRIVFILGVVLLYCLALKYDERHLKHVEWLLSCRKKQIQYEDTVSTQLAFAGWLLTKTAVAFC